MGFKLDIICAAKAHCELCRQLNAGRRWRASVARLAELQEVDFSCPEGHEFKIDTMPANPLQLASPPPPDEFNLIKKQILSLKEVNDRSRFLRAMLAQLEQLISENRGGSCQNRAAYRRRLRQKLVYYWTNYSPCNS